MDAHDAGFRVLVKNGIREPLYVTALKYAGVEVTRRCNPGISRTLKPAVSTEALAALEPLGSSNASI